MNPMSQSTQDSNIESLNSASPPQIHPLELIHSSSQQHLSTASPSLHSSPTPTLTSLLLAKVTASLHAYTPSEIHFLPYPLLLATLSQIQHHITPETLLSYFPPHLFPHSAIPSINFQLNGSLDAKIIQKYLRYYRIGALNMSHCLLGDDTFKKGANSENAEVSRKSRKRSASSTTGTAPKSAIFDLLDLEMQSVQQRGSVLESSTGPAVDSRLGTLREAPSVSSAFLQSSPAQQRGSALSEIASVMNMASAVASHVAQSTLGDISADSHKTHDKKKKKRRNDIPQLEDLEDTQNRQPSSSRTRSKSRSRDNGPRGGNGRAPRRRSSPLSIPSNGKSNRNSLQQQHSSSGGTPNGFQMPHRSASPAIVSASSAPQNGTTSFFPSPSTPRDSISRPTSASSTTSQKEPTPLFQSLRSLNISYIPHLSSQALKAVASNFPALRMLSLESNSKINNSCLKIIAKRMPQLVALNIRGCRNVASLKELHPLKSLEILNVSFIPRLSSIGECNKFASTLTYLNISNCQKISSIDDFDTPTFSVLKTLDLSNCSDVSSVDNLVHLESLEALSLSNLATLTSIECVGELKHLRKLDLSGCKGLHSIAPVKNLVHLKNLDISRTHIALDEDVTVFASMSHLKALNIAHCPVETVAALRCVTSLEHLNHSGVQLENIDEWRQLYQVLPHLRSIHANQCFLSTYETDYCPFERTVLCADALTPHLTHLNLSGCTLVNDRWMALLPSHIISLDISNTCVTPKGLKNLRSLSEAHLETFIAKHVLQEDILDLPLSTEHLWDAFVLLGKCCSLHTLDISHSSVSNEMLFELSHLKLRHFDMTNCNKISNPKTLLHLGGTLQVLNMSGILISDAFLSHFPQCMHQLHTLRMSVSRFLTNTGMDSLHELPNLVYLRTKQLHVNP